MPILRYAASGGPAQLVAEKLGRRLHDQLKAHPALFSDGQASGFQRPLLVLCERSLDLSVMVRSLQYAVCSRWYGGMWYAACSMCCGLSPVACSV